MSVSLTKTLDIVDDRDVVKHSISFNEVDLVSDVLNQIRTKQHLAQNVQIVFVGIEGLQQSAPSVELQGNDRMWQHFPDGGKVRVDAKHPTPTPANMTIRNNRAHAGANANNLIVFSSEESRNAIIEDNQAFKDARQNNIITNDTSILATLDLGFHKR